MNITSKSFKVKLHKGFLTGILEISKNKIKGTAILMHGRKSSKDSDTYKDIAKIFHKNNFQTVRFDFRGHGESGGSPNWQNYGIMDWEKDLEGVMDWLVENQHLNGQLVLLGSSFAGDAILTYEGKKNMADKIVLLAPGIGRDSLGIKNNFSRKDWWDRVKATTQINFKKYSTLLKKINTEVYLLHGDSDVVVPIEQSKELQEIIGDNVELFVIKTGEHNYWKSKDAMLERRKLIDRILSST